MRSHPRRTPAPSTVPRAPDSSRGFCRMGGIVLPRDFFLFFFALRYCYAHRTMYSARHLLRQLSFPTTVPVSVMCLPRLFSPLGSRLAAKRLLAWRPVCRADPSPSSSVREREIHLHLSLPLNKSSGTRSITGAVQPSPVTCLASVWPSLANASIASS